jgi:Family of unknown function (DUF6441)
LRESFFRATRNRGFRAPPAELTRWRKERAPLKIGLDYQDDAITNRRSAMKLVAALAPSLQADMQMELRDIERAVSRGTRKAGRGLRTELRRQVTSAGLGQRLANSWRDKHYPNKRLDAASLVYTKAPQIIRAFAEGAMIRSRRRRFLAIPTESAPRKGTDGKRIRPSRRTGKLRASGEPPIGPNNGATV